jgi:hypothetical protein
LTRPSTVAFITFLCYTWLMDDLTLPTTARPVIGISREERARRKAAVDYARASVRLEGFVVTDHAEDLNRRFIEGELTSAELTAAILANPHL